MTVFLFNICEKISTAIISFLWQEILFSSILFAIIYLISKCLKKQRPYWKLGLWSLILIRLMLPPNLSQPYSGRMFFNRLIREIRESILLHPTANISFVEERSNFLDKNAPQFGTVHNSSIPWQIPLFTLWMTGMGISTCLYVHKRKKFTRIIRNAISVTHTRVHHTVEMWRLRFGIKRKIRIVTSDDFLSPFTLGTLQPIIYMPDHLLRKASSEHIESIIAHEMAHVKRLDELWMLIQNMLQMVYFFHPVVWITNSQITFARECICDHMVLNQHKISAETYGNSLLTILKTNLFGLDGLKTVSGLGNKRNQLRIRIQNMKGAYHMKKHGWIVSIWIYCLLGFFLLPMAQGHLNTSGSEEANSTVSECAEKKTKSDQASEEIQDIQITLINPVPESKIAAHFGPLIDPYTNQERFHNAVDLRALEGTEILAPADGTVLIAESDYEKDKGYGKYILIDHGKGIQTKCAHLAEVAVEKGQGVLQGESIGKVGSTGRSTGSHLHFELIKDDQHLDPEKYIQFEK